jgi:hypothetical protein
MSPKYRYVTNCTSALAEDINDMTDQAREITYGTLVKHVGAEQLAEVFPNYNWKHDKSQGLRMEKDWAVSFWKSTYRGEPCYYVDWSRFEFIFVLES